MSKFTAHILLFVLVAAAFLILPFLFETPEAAVSQALLQKLSSIRPAGGRLFDAVTVQPSADTTALALRDAEIAILSVKDSKLLQGLVDIHRGDLNGAAEILLDASRTNPGDAGVLNDLGVVYLVEGNENAAQSLKAIQLFERARRASPAALAPRFNLVLAYRRLGLDPLARTAQMQYERLEQDHAWIRSLASDDVQPDETVLAAQLLRLLNAGDETAAASLFENHLGFYRRLTREEALNPSSQEIPSPIFRFAAKRILIDFQDATIASMLGPLDAPYKAKIIKSRQFVHAGIDLYFLSRYEDSLHQYNLAEHEVATLPPGFDHLWIELNRANSEIRLKCATCMQAATGRLEQIIEKANDEKLLWIKGQALTSKTTTLTVPDYGQLAQNLVDAVNELTAIGAKEDSVRAANFLATIYNSANDFERSFQLLQQARTLTRKEDHIRLAQLFGLAGSVAFRLGCGKCAVSYAKQGLEEAQATGNPQTATNALSILATLLESVHEHDQAKQYLIEIRSNLKRFPPSRDKELVELPVTFLCSRTEIAAGNIAGAERCAQESKELLDRLTFKPPDYSVENLIQMARIYQGTSRLDLARKTYEQAADVIETNDRYFEAPGLRAPFENQRRGLYETAITFEADHNGMDAAWTYLQRYRSKLFLEFLGQMNPNVNKIHSEAVQRSQVQRLIPDDVQVVEYVMLPDRLLVWLVSGDRFVSQSVPVSRAELQTAVSSFLEGMQTQQDVSLQSEKLYQLLIAPIEDKLDPHRALAIIPDQDLHRLPFPALWNASKRHFLTEDFTLLESPSLTQLLATSGMPPRTSAVAFGSIADDSSTSDELAAMKIYPSEKTFTGNFTNKQEFLAAMNHAGIFQYSGHSVDASDPLRSSLLLDGDREGPNSITALDVSRQHMRMNSLVVLASCDSSVGNSRDGIGMRGLTSAFLIGGAGSVVGSLWLVETFGTSHLVSNFHQRYAAGTSAAESLREAQIAFIHSGSHTAHPFYWSGFVVTGNLSALR